MKSLILSITAALAIAACTTPIALGPSSEAQLKVAVDSVNAVGVGATIALREHKITVNQAKGYSTMFKAVESTLIDINADLVQCRKDTGSTEKTQPDPCWPQIKDVVTVVLENLTSMKKALNVH